MKREHPESFYIVKGGLEQGKKPRDIIAEGEVKRHAVYSIIKRHNLMKIY